MKKTLLIIGSIFSLIVILPIAYIVLMVSISMSPFAGEIVWLTGDYPGRGWRYVHGGMFIGCNPKMFPDGKRIVFSSPRSGQGDIYVMNSDGTNLVQLTNNPAYDGEPDVSPDSSKIVFISERNRAGEIFIMNANGSGQTRLTNNNNTKNYDSSPEFSSDGRRIIFNHLIRFHWDGFDKKAYSETLTMNIDGSDIKKLPDKLEDNHIGFEPTISPSGNKLIFLSGGYEKGELYYEIYCKDSSNSHIQQLTHLHKYIGDISFTPDNSKVLFVSQPPGTPEHGKGEICILNLADLSVKVIRNNY